MENDSLVLKGLTGSVILIGATLVAIPGGASDSEPQRYGITTDSLEDHDYASSVLAEDSENRIGVAAAPQSQTALKPKREKEEDFELLDLQTEQVHELSVTEEIEFEDTSVTFTDSDGEEAAYITVREEGEIKHDEAYSEGEDFSYKDIDVEVESIDHEQESAELKTSYRDGYVIHGSTSVNELVEKIEKVNPRIDASELKQSDYNALIITGEKTEEAVKNLASLQEGVEKSEIDIETS